MRHLPILLLLAVFLTGCDLGRPPVNTVALIGQTPEQVEAQLGKPREVIYETYMAAPLGSTEAEQEEYYASTVAEIWDYPKITLFFNAKGVVLAVTTNE